MGVENGFLKNGFIIQLFFFEGGEEKEVRRSIWPVCGYKTSNTNEQTN